MNPYKSEGAHIVAPDMAQTSAALVVKATQKAHQPTGPPHEPLKDDFAYWRFADLKERRIVTDRADLFRKQQRGFPRAVKLSKGQGAVALFPQDAVKAWLHANISTANVEEN